MPRAYWPVQRPPNKINNPELAAILRAQPTQGSSQMKSKKDVKRKMGPETRFVTVIDLKAPDRVILKAMAKRYRVSDLVDFLEGIVMKEQGPNVGARFYDDPAS
jgi:hypothetical protein